MKLIFVHGWSVTHTDTYGDLPSALANASNQYGLQLDIQHIYLGKYISFHDEVNVDDIARAMDKALRDLPGNSADSIATFSCITHSTGGPVVRAWVDRYYGARNLATLPLQHLIMLAPANHGSSLATLGKARVGRIKAWFGGVEPGQGVLDWLCLGSDGQWGLNERSLRYDYVKHGFYPFVLTGQGIDNKFYDFLNHYLIEPGSDGVVRVSGANLNYQFLTLEQQPEQPIEGENATYPLRPKGNVRKSKPVAIGVYNDYSHSGKKMGIMRSISSDDTDAPVVTDVLKCLSVDGQQPYSDRVNELSELTKQQQELGHNKDEKSRYCMIVFSVRDDEGNIISRDDYDLYMLAGNKYREDKLPKGFFKDRQMNNQTSRLVYYLNADKMSEIKDKKFGLRVVARPSSGFSYYRTAEYHSDGVNADKVFQANETTYIEIILHRFVDENVFRFSPATEKPQSFKRVKPSGKTLNNS